MPDMKDRRSKKNKKKQAMSEVDLEAGEQIAELDAPTIAKAIYETLSDGGPAEVEIEAEVANPSV
jgi:hypothetical protein